jgi:uncharacterized protein YfaS (alpha-2-macroglobulin family)
MRKPFAPWLVTGIVLVAGLVAIAASPREDQWKKVDEAVAKGLPKTAIEHLQPIIDGALKDKAYPEAIKAIAKRISLEGSIEGNKPEEKIVRLEAEIEKAPAEMRPAMQAVLAHWYWHYFQQNRWRFMQRTETTESPGSDITTWSLPRILAEIDKQFTAALGAKEELRKTPIEQYAPLLEKGTMPDSYRPTLYDFIAFQALEFYSAGEQAGSRAQDAFDLLATSPVFDPADDFMKWKIETTDEQSAVVKALRLYQELLQFHAKDENQDAFLDANLARLTFGYNKAVGQEKNDRYKDALKKFVDKWGDHPVSARARHAWAAVLQEEGDLVEAHRLAQQGANAFPNTPGGNLCHNLVQQIEAKQAQITTERVWNKPWPTIEVRYRNVTRVHFRLVKRDWIELSKTRRGNIQYLDDAVRQSLVAAKPDKTWSADLPATEDFQERAEEIEVPQDVAPGFYFLLSSHDEAFSASNNVVQYTNVWVSDLAMVLRSSWNADRLEGFVLDNLSGEPIAGAEVQLYVRQDRGGYLAGEKGQTDENGLFAVTGPHQKQCILLASHKGQQISTDNDMYVQRFVDRTNTSEQTVFFTDRSLYRPGQTIHYKGISLSVDQDGDNYKTLPARSLTVVFQDPNGKEIARQPQRTNDYGSFSGSFTAPRDRLTGRMMIRVDGGPPGGTSLSVEEYKRPKFQVAIEAPTEPAKLNETVQLSGKATAYTGAAIGGANIRYRVVRQVRYPVWWGWYRWWMPPQDRSQEIAHGRTRTENDGSFKLEFVARPDLSVPEKDEPTFRFVVYADVTDTTGETRSAEQSINVGYTALQASMSAAEWLTAAEPVDIQIQTTTLDGVGQKAEGAVKIYHLQQPDKVKRGPLAGRYPYMPMSRRGGKIVEPVNPKPDPSNPATWEQGELAAEEGFTTDAHGNATIRVKLAAGPYRAVLETQDRYNKKVTARLPLTVLAPEARRLPLRIANLVAAPKWTLEPGDEFMALWGTGYEQGRAYIEVEHRRKIIKSFWTEPGATQQTVKHQVDEGMRGGFTLHVTMVRENRAYLTSRNVDVPWTNKQLTVKWERFVSKMEPAQKETWTAIVTGPDAKKAVAEMVATLYDKSLDAYLPHQWMTMFNVFRQDRSNLNLRFENVLRQLQHLHGQWPHDYRDATITYRSFPHDLTANLWGYQSFGRRGGRALAGAAPAPMAPGMENRRANMLAEADAAPMEKAAAKRDGLAADKPQRQAPAEQEQAGPDLSKVAARTNLNETAFFFPHLVSGDDGTVKLEFTMPEALTTWRFMGFAHDGALRSGSLQDETVTAKDLMVEPNPPRFLREGDVLEFTVKVSNQSAAAQKGKVRLTLADARTGGPIDDAMGNATPDQTFDIASKESKSFSWRLTVPDGQGPVIYKAIGGTERLADGEEGMLPVLSRRVLVTESLPLPIRGPQTKHFSFTRLAESAKSDTLRHQSLSVQMVSNPSWYAVMAMPYLMEFPHECSEQVFNRVYANSLARHIAQSDPKIRRVFDQWKNTPALDSPLEKNQDVKAVTLEETPWLRQAQAESQARRNVGILFDDNRLNDEQARQLAKLAQMQREDGAWPWFPGGPPNDYITLYITTGFGRLRHLGVKIDTAVAVKSLGHLDGWIDRIYREILRHGRKDDNHLSTTIALYLYGRSFFLEDKPIDANHKEAVDYFLGQARKYWLQLAVRQSQGHLAIALKRFGDRETPADIMRSIKERSVSNEEMGMFWRDLELSWWWFRAPIETQALMIEAFDEVMNDEQAVEECKVWLLKQKQTQDWKTTKATADAVYALLLRGENQLASDVLVEIALGDTTIKPENVEAGTGFYEQRFVRGEVSPKMADITVTKRDKGVAWGSVHWQYLEDMAKVTAYEGTPLKLSKTLALREYTPAGPRLTPVRGPIAVGDELVVRLVLRVDRDMEYVHLKDLRGSGTEPVNVLSAYKYQDGLAYYEATRDTATHFFIDYLPKGAYVFEYSVRVVHRGKYQTGFASIQSMYAPEFNSHSESLPLEVK